MRPNNGDLMALYNNRMERSSLRGRRLLVLYVEEYWGFVDYTVARESGTCIGDPKCTVRRHSDDDVPAHNCVLSPTMGSLLGAVIVGSENVGNSRH